MCFTNICNKTNILTADAEQVAQLAGQDLTNTLLSNAVMFAGAVMKKDLTHAARRTLQRPINADPDVKEVVDRLFMGRSSIVQRVRHSEEFRVIYSKSVKADELDPFESNDVDSASNAKHRFDSVFRSAVRFVKTFDAWIAVANVFCVVRSGTEEGYDAESFLLYISNDAGLRVLLLVGLLCECCKISLKLIRFFDADAYDAAAMSSVIKSWATEMDLLIIQKKAFGIEGTYANLLIHKIIKLRVVIVKGRLYSIGGFKHGQHEMHLQHAYEKFCAWSAMSISVVLAEFPDWDILSSFDVFWIPGLPTSEQIRLHLQRIAQFYTIDFFRVVRPIPENSSIGSSQIFFKPRHQGCKYLAGGDSRYQGCDAASGCDHQICHCGWNNHFRYRACSQHSGLVVHKEAGTAFECQ